MMLLIKTNLATFGNWKDCYLFMVEEDIQEVHVFETSYLFKKVLDGNVYSLKEVGQMADVIPFDY